MQCIQQLQERRTARREHQLYLQKQRQKRHRERQRQKEQDCEERVKELKSQTERLMLYRMFLSRKQQMFASPRLIQLRGLTVEIFGDYFQYGVDPQKAEHYAKQVAFLQYHFSSQSLLYCPSDGAAGKRGQNAILEILQQGRRFTSLHDEFKATPHSVKQHDAEGTVFSMVQDIVLTITQRAIQALYPHMLYNQAFMRKVIPKQLKFQVISTIPFAENMNTVETIHIEHQLPRAWCQLLQDPKLAFSVTGFERGLGEMR